MKNGLSLNLSPLTLPSSIKYTKSSSNKNSHHYNIIFNSKYSTNNTLSAQKKIAINNFSSSKYHKNKLITKHYNIVSNLKSINDKKLLFNANLQKPILAEPKCGLQKFLPPKISKKHKTLVIDLDETLVHSYFDIYPLKKKPDMSFQIINEEKLVHIYTLVRPGAIDFLNKMSELFEIVIFTASVSKYALPIINFIDKENKCEFKLFREHCSIFNNGFTKDLKRLSRDLNNLIILDNNPNCFFLNKENGFPIKTWIDDIHDKELFKIIPYLKFLANEKIKDVRPILTKIKRGNDINYASFDKIIKKYNKLLNNSDNTKDMQIFDKTNDKNNAEEKELPNVTKKSNLDKNEELKNTVKIDAKENNKKILKNENNEEKNENNEEKNDSHLEDKAILNKLKSFRETKLFNNKNNFSENLDINKSDNIFNKKNTLDASKYNVITTPTKNTIRGLLSNNIFNKTLFNNISSIKYDEKENFHQIILKPISTKYLDSKINSTYNFSSQYNESSNNKEEKNQDNSIFNECKNKNNYLSNVNGLLPSIKVNNNSLLSSKDNIKMIRKYTDYYRILNNCKKNNTIHFTPKEINDINDSKKTNYYTLTKMNMNMNRSNSERNSILTNNFNRINNKKINLFNEEKLFCKNNKKYSKNMQFNRTLSNSKTPKKILKNILNYRIFSSHKKIFPKNNNISNESINIFNNTHHYHLNKIRSFRKEIKNILFINKSNFINKSDLNPTNDNNIKINNNNLDIKNCFAKNTNEIWKKNDIII